MCICLIQAITFVFKARFQKRKETTTTHKFQFHMWKIHIYWCFRIGAFFICIDITNISQYSSIAYCYYFNNFIVFVLVCAFSTLHVSSLTFTYIQIVKIKRRLRNDFQIFTQTPMQYRHFKIFNSEFHYTKQSAYFEYVSLYTCVIFFLFIKLIAADVFVITLSLCKV